MKICFDYAYILFIVDDFINATLKIAKYYVNSKFTDIAMYSQFGEEINFKITDLYTPMVWKEIEQDTAKPKDQNISVHHLLTQVLCLPYLLI